MKELLKQALDACILDAVGAALAGCGIPNKQVDEVAPQVLVLLKRDFKSYTAFLSALAQPAVAEPNEWREAIDAELVCLHLGTVDSFHSANEALDALINWHVAVALDPEVSLDAQALVDRGAAQAAPESAVCDGGTCGLGGYCVNCPKQKAAPAVAEPLTDDELRECFTGTNTSEPLTEGWPGLERFARAVEAAHGIKASK